MAVHIFGTVNIDSSIVSVLGVLIYSMVCTTDIGNVRDWHDLHRYALQFASLIDGTCICVGNICMPRTMSRCLAASGFAHILYFS